MKSDEPFQSLCTPECSMFAFIAKLRECILNNSCHLLPVCKAKMAYFKIGYSRIACLISNIAMKNIGRARAMIASAIAPLDPE
ncbi:hypothetical protein K3165_00240 [Qipengyuania sp. 1XM1-15A]|uniref:hypothetical protein n=1 Tax=Qipengyuania xiamenensis TaxID=2867237 RepID=UPI001C87196D|nr:hypothetical protein [Qipengyuania xiamenensis]MBX7531344.1 hypothetical protein [Qipengyuania xiamenensis]